jgi:uncharacterized protein (TIGR00251 family)
MSAWFHWQDDTLILQLHLQPKAKKDEIVGPHGDALKVRITAPPVDGKANAHLLKFLARVFGVRQQQVSLLSGDSSRQKRVAIVSPNKLPSPWFNH